MKSIAKFIPLVLTFALVAWAQTATPNPSSASNAQKAPAAQSNSKADCPCCQKMADGKDAMACCRHDANGKDAAMACCNGKDAKSCMKADKSAKASCAGGKCCTGKDVKNCCAGPAKDGAMAMACCGKGQCGMGNHGQRNMDK